MSKIPVNTQLIVSSIIFMGFILLLVSFFMQMAKLF